MTRLTIVAFAALCTGVHAADLSSLLVDAQTQFQASHYEQALKLYNRLAVVTDLHEQMGSLFPLFHVKGVFPNYCEQCLCCMFL